MKWGRLRELQLETSSLVNFVRLGTRYAEMQRIGGIALCLELARALENPLSQRPYQVRSRFPR